MEDIAWFFKTDPVDGTQTCRVCQYVIFYSICCLLSDQVCNSATRAAGKAAPAGVDKKSTGGGNLRTHIDKNHGELYSEQASSKGWMNKLPSQTKSCADATDLGAPRSPCPNTFTVTKLHNALVNFITADDQV